MAEHAGTPAGDGTRTEGLYLQAKDHFGAGSYPEAIRCLTPLLSEPIYVLRAEANIGSSLLMMGLFRPALKFLDRALRRDPNFLPALLTRLKVLRAEQRDEEVVKICEPIVERWPQEEEAWSLLVASLRATGRDERALEFVGLWLAHLPQSLEGHLLKGELLSNRGDQNQAVISLGRALGLAPGSEKVYSHLSVVMIRMRRHEAALQYLDKALGINPNAFINHCRKALVLWLTADWRGASVWYEKAAAMQPHSAIYRLNQHLVLPGIPASLEDIHEARQLFLEGLSLVENNPDLKLNVQDEAIPHTFELAYHNQDDRLLLERYIDLMRKLCEPLLEDARERAAADRLSLPALLRPQQYDRLLRLD
jgi:protein O-GlcNAc transferase